MKHIFLAAMLAVGLAAGAQSVKWLETQHNFGAFDESLGPVSTDFRFVNTTGEPVAITAARASCGCTQPKYSRDPIAPGDTATVTVTYDPAGRPGRFSKYVAVTLSDGSERTKLLIDGTVVGAPASVAQRFPVDCGDALQLAKGAVVAGEVTKGKMRTVFLEAYNRSTDTIAPAVTYRPAYVDATVTPGKVPPGEQFSMIYYLRSADCPLYGFVNDSVTIAYNGHECTVPFTANIREDFSKMKPKEIERGPRATVATGSIDFGRLQKEPLTATATVKNTGKTTLRIHRAYTFDPGITVEAGASTLKPGKETTITVTVDPQDIAGAFLNARISLITNDPTNPVQTIRAVGEIER